MKTFSSKKIEFFSKMLADLGKAIFIVGLASYFFEKFPLGWRISFSILSVILMFAGLFIFPEGNNGGEE